MSASEKPATAKRTWINVNKHIIAKNAREGTTLPPVRFSVGKSGKQTYCHELEILDRDGNPIAAVIYDPHKPLLKCGARLAIAASYGVRVVR